MVKISFEVKPMNYPADRRGIETKAVPTLSFRLVRSPLLLGRPGESLRKANPPVCGQAGVTERAKDDLDGKALRNLLIEYRLLNPCAHEFEESVLFFAASL